MPKIHNPKTKQWVEVTCTGCMCHDMAMQFGDLYHGCCNQCGCPKNEAGWAHYIEQYPDRVRGHEPELGGKRGRIEPGDAPTLSQ